MKGYAFEDYNDAIDVLNDNMSLNTIEKYAKIVKMQRERRIQRVSEGNINKAINRWRIGTYSNEKAYENDLASYLRSRFGNSTIKQQSGRNKVDIEVINEQNTKERYPIELKFNFGLDARSRLDYQLGQYWREYKKRTFLVVCGINDFNAWSDFKHHTYPKYSSKVHLIVKKDKVISKHLSKK